MTKSNLSLVKILICLIAIGLYTCLFIKYDFSIFKKVTTIAAVLGLAGYSSYKFFRRYAMIYAEYMGNKKTVLFDKKVDKPRIFIHSVAWPLIVLFIGVFYYANASGIFWMDVLLFYSFQVIIILTFSLLNFTWSTSFENRYKQKPVTENNLGNDREFKTALSVVDLTTVFDGLTKYGFISYEDHDELINARKEFIAIFRSGVPPNQPRFKLEFKNPDTAYFLEKLQLNTSSLTSVRFVNIFTNLNGIIKPESLSSSSSQAKKRSHGSRNMLKLDLIFEQID
ncbi:hypothetical protein GCM10023231_22590 [Olivibacter ginsenosidimutans]|uniref:Uncharacterized protein n=1 Tax=Olivibacter ginsenosidimutans TaxID=1176537 RepID=A0ABP9BCT0_9SPHI